jgi:transposase
LRGRPIYHQKRDSIEAHLTIVFTALAISRLIEKNTKISIKHFVKIFRPIRRGKIQIGKHIYPTNDVLTPEATNILRDLKY